MSEQKCVQSMRILKKRIIMTDELISKFKEKVEENEKCQHQVKDQSKYMRSLQSAIHGLKREIDCLHKEKEKYLVDWQGGKLEMGKLKQENERLRWSLLSEEQTNKSLTKELQSAQTSQMDINVSENRELTTDELINKYKEKEEENQKCRHQVKEQSNYVQSLQSVIQDLKTEIDCLRKEKERFFSDWQSGKLEMEKLKQENECLKLSLLSEELTNKSLTKELQRAQSSHMDVNLYSENMEIITESLTNELQRAQSSHMDVNLPSENKEIIAESFTKECQRAQNSHMDANVPSENRKIITDDNNDDEELEKIFSEFPPLISLSPLPPSPVVCQEDSFVRAPTLSPLPPSPTSMSSHASPIPNSPTGLTLCLSPPLSVDAQSTDLFEIQSTNPASWKNLPSTALLSPLSLSPSLSPLSPLQQPASDNSLSPLPLTPAVSPLSPLHQPHPSGSHLEVKKELEITVSINKVSNTSKSIGSSAANSAVAFSPDLSMAQRELCAAMQCPLPLPSWLVSSMAAVQDMKEHCLQRHWGKKGKKKKMWNCVRTRPVFRKQHLTPQHYVFNNLQLLFSDQIHLSTIITMFTDENSVPSSEDVTAGVIQFFQEVYRPKIEHVLALFHEQCKLLRTNAAMADTIDPNFVPALLRPECQLVTLLAHMCRLSPVMVNLLHESCWVLQQAIMKHGINFHKLLAMSRVLTALLRLQNDSERLQCFMADLLKKPILPNEMYVIVGIGTIWPAPFNRKNSPPLQRLRVVNLRALEESMLRTTLEVAVLHKYHSEGVMAGVHEAFPKNLQTYYGWNLSLHADQLAESLLQILQSSKNVNIDLTPMSLRPWQRPRPSVVAYQLVYCITVLAASKRWSWTCNFLITKYLWPIVQEWSSTNIGIKGQQEKVLNESQENLVVSDAVMVCVLRLLGFLCTGGLKEDPCSSFMERIRHVMVDILKESSGNSCVTLPMQLATVDSLLEMTPIKHTQYSHVTETVKLWLRAQQFRDWFYPLHTELNHRFKLNI